MRVLALGHSTLPLDAFLARLAAVGVSTVADIRTIPRSRANPQFESATLARALAQAGIGYAHLPRLGGLRHARKDSPNGAWRNASFRGYADHMATAEFEEGLLELRALARRGPVALLCAEAVPWRCHRSLVADALFARGVVVEHVTGPGRTRPHRLTPFARVTGRRVTYPAAEGAASPAPPVSTASAAITPPRRRRRSPGRPGAPGGGGGGRSRARAPRSRA